MVTHFKTYASDHAGSSATNLQVVLSNSGTVEHGVKSSDLVHLHGRHLEDLGNLVHRRERQEIVVLLLSDKKRRDAGRALVVVGVLLQKRLDRIPGSGRELEGRRLNVVWRVAVVGEHSERAGSSLGHGLAGSRDLEQSTAEHTLYYKLGIFSPINSKLLMMGFWGFGAQ